LRTSQQKKQLFASLADGHEPRFGNQKIVERITIDGYKYIMADGSWVMLRASGTEPVVRIYMETTKPDSFARWQKQILEDVKQLIA
jgi:phosphomannomutase